LVVSQNIDARHLLEALGNGSDEGAVSESGWSIAKDVAEGAFSGLFQRYLDFSEFPGNYGAVESCIVQSGKDMSRLFNAPHLHKPPRLENYEPGVGRDPHQLTDSGQRGTEKNMIIVRNNEKANENRHETPPVVCEKPKLIQA
jgi:hypothetical protein